MRGLWAMLLLLCCGSDPWAARDAELGRLREAAAVGDDAALERLAELSPGEDFRRIELPEEPWWLPQNARSEPIAIKVGAAKVGADPRIAAALSPFVAEGRVEEAARQLRELPGGGTLAESLRRLDARIREGRSALLGGRLEEAIRRLEAAIEEERGLPLEEESGPVAALRRDLAEALVARADRERRRGRLVEAYVGYERALQLDEASAVALQGMDALAAIVDRELAGEPDCARLGELLASVDGGSPLGRKAARRFARCRDSP